MKVDSSRNKPWHLKRNVGSSFSCTVFRIYGSHLSCSTFFYRMDARNIRFRSALYAEAERISSNIFAYSAVVNIEFPISVLQNNADWVSTSVCIFWSVQKSKSIFITTHIIPIFIYLTSGDSSLDVHVSHNLYTWFFLGHFFYSFYRNAQVSDILWKYIIHMAFSVLFLTATVRFLSFEWSKFNLFFGITSTYFAFNWTLFNTD